MVYVGSVIWCIFGGKNENCGGWWKRVVVLEWCYFFFGDMLLCGNWFKLVVG